MPNKANNLSSVKPKGPDREAFKVAGNGCRLERAETLTEAFPSLAPGESTGEDGEDIQHTCAESGVARDESGDGRHLPALNLKHLAELVGLHHIALHVALLVQCDNDD